MGHDGRMSGEGRNGALGGRADDLSSESGGAAKVGQQKGSERKQRGDRERRNFVILSILR
jgi:hypothetical protein